MKTPIEVYIRAKPTDSFANKNIQFNTDQNDISIFIPKKTEDGPINHKTENWNFHFDKIFINDSQEKIFDQIGKKAVYNLVQGYSTSLLAYGQTGAGKTFSISGYDNDYRYRGILPRTISQIFKETNLLKDIDFTVKFSFVEIYNENLLDLLNPGSSNQIVLQEDPAYGIIAKGAKIKTVKSENEALELMFQAETNRTTQEHIMNRCSSRSHGVFTIFLEASSKYDSKEKVTISRLNILDLAGSERSKKTMSKGKTLLEASFINKSLTFLEQLIVLYADNK